LEPLGREEEPELEAKQDMLGCVLLLLLLRGGTRCGGGVCLGSKRREGTRVTRSVDRDETAEAGLCMRRRIAGMEVQQVLVTGRRAAGQHVQPERVASLSPNRHSFRRTSLCLPPISRQSESMSMSKHLPARAAARALVRSPRVSPSTLRPAALVGPRAIHPRWSTAPPLFGRQQQQRSFLTFLTASSPSSANGGGEKGFRGGQGGPEDEVVYFEEKTMPYVPLSFSLLPVRYELG
jgi:hypothetical protein